MGITDRKNVEFNLIGKPPFFYILKIRVGNTGYLDLHLNHQAYETLRMEVEKIERMRGKNP